MTLVSALWGADPLYSVEMRPPRANLGGSAGLEAWIDANHSLRRLARMNTVVFVTDNAVGRREEENLQHLVSNVGRDVDPGGIVPFLTCKHPLDYCLWYAQRAWQSGFRALVVLGGDPHDGVPRCVPHAQELRRLLRAQQHELVLGGWANTGRDPAVQVGYLGDAAFEADFYLTQVVSHLEIGAVERFLAEAERRGLKLPGLFGVFYYRSANDRTLQKLARFLPVPVEKLKAEFASGATADEICARTLRALGSLGVCRYYISNLPTAESPRVLARLKEMARS